MHYSDNSTRFRYTPPRLYTLYPGMTPAYSTHTLLHSRYSHRSLSSLVQFRLQLFLQPFDDSLPIHFDRVDLLVERFNLYEGRAYICTYACVSMYVSSYVHVAICIYLDALLNSNVYVVRRYLLPHVENGDRYKRAAGTRDDNSRARDKTCMYLSHHHR